MVIDQETLMPLHRLTEEGKKSYDEFLASRADELILKAEYPITCFLAYLSGKLGLEISCVENRRKRLLEEIKIARA